MKLFHKNRGLLSDYADIDLSVLDFPFTVTPFPSRNEGTPILEIQRDDSKKTLGSRYSVTNESIRWLDNLEDIGELHIIVGLGCMDHICAFRKKYPDTVICIIEPDIRFLAVLSCHYDFSKIIPSPGLFLLQTTDELIHYSLSGLFTKIGISVSPGYKSVFPSETDLTVCELRRVVTKVQSDWLTQSTLAGQWYTNSVLNLKRMSKRRVEIPSPEDMRVIVTGAGPGLEQIERIDTENAFIIATDTSLSYLITKHIIPRIVISIDGRNISFLNFINTTEESLYLFDIVCPHLITRNCVNKLYITSYFPFILYFLKMKNVMPLYDSSPGNVGAAALFFAAMTGTRRIETFGMDFSYPRGDAYVRGSYIPEYFYQRQNRINTYLSMNWDLISTYSLRYSQKDKRYTTPLLDQYSSNTTSFMEAMGFTREGSSYINTRNNLNKGFELSNTGFNTADLQNYKSSLKRTAGKLHSQIDYYRLSVPEQELMQTIFPLMSTFRTDSFCDRIYSALRELTKLIGQE